jgi:hypothetical protein
LSHRQSWLPGRRRFASDQVIGGVVEPHQLRLARD